MPRALILLIVVFVFVIGGAIFLAGRNTEIAPTRVEKPVVLNEAAPH